MKRSELLDLGEMLVWIGVTLIKALSAPSAINADDAARKFREQFDRRHSDDSA